MSASPTAYKELRSLILRLDAAINDSGGSETDEREAKEDLASTAKLLMEQGPGEKGGDESPWGSVTPSMFNCSERGANLWFRGDDRIHFIKRLGKAHWLNICYTANNYPAFEIELLEMTTAKLAAGLTESYKRDQLVLGKMNDFEIVFYADGSVKRFKARK